MNFSKESNSIQKTAYKFDFKYNKVIILGVDPFWLHLTPLIQKLQELEKNLVAKMHAGNFIRIQN